MVYLSGLDSIIESIYLDDLLSNQMGRSQIFVNPDQIKYITNKTIIISKNGYSLDDVNRLVDNGNKVISRIFFDTDKVEIQPYIIRVNNKIQFNGRYVDEDKIGKIDDIMLKGYCEFDETEHCLYFPKINMFDKNSDLYMDSYNNLTSYGWALQQVGINLKKCPFVDLDVIKLKKVIM
jgi:hypothetical protein